MTSKILVYTDRGFGACEVGVAITISSLQRAVQWLVDRGALRREEWGKEEERGVRREEQGERGVNKEGGKERRPLRREDWWKGGGERETEPLNLKNKSKDEAVGRTDAAAIINGVLDSGVCKLLVLPGGRDLPYCSLLNGAGNGKIRQFIENGGGYLGICAGGYYGASHVEFARGDPYLEVVGSRELQFFPGKAEGPVFPGFQYGSHAGSQVCSLLLQPPALALLKKVTSLSSIAGKTTTPTLGEFPSGSLGEVPVLSYFNGGCQFVPIEDTGGGCYSNDPMEGYYSAAGYEVLATYGKYSITNLSIPCTISESITNPSIPYMNKQSIATAQDPNTIPITAPSVNHNAVIVTQKPNKTTNDKLSTLVELAPPISSDSGGAAIVTCGCGLGKVILMGAHLETSEADLSTHYNDDLNLLPLLPPLAAAEATRSELFAAIVGYLLMS